MVQSLLQSALKPEMTYRANTYQPSSQGPCCDRDCRFNVGNQCREDNGCRDESYCDGRGTACPPSILKPNKTVCNEEFVCFQVTVVTMIIFVLMMMLLRIELRRVVTKKNTFYQGECTGSICLAYGLESCQCRQGPEDKPTKVDVTVIVLIIIVPLSAFPFLIVWVILFLTFDDVRPVSFVAKHLGKTSLAYRLSRLYLYLYSLFVCVLHVLL